MRLPFVKMHSVGNDFVVLDARDGIIPPPALIAQLADRRRAIGFDQLLLLVNSDRPGCDYGYRVYNADGSRSAQCGNGARCLARFLVEQRISDQRQWRIALSNGEMVLTYRHNGAIDVLLPSADFTPTALPMRVAEQQPVYELFVDGQLLSFGAVSVGNPHAVIVVDDIDGADVGGIGLALQRHDMFPASVNVGFMRMDGRRTMHLRVCERGVGETPGCGSGACAAVAVARMWGIAADEVSVHMRGGTVTVAVTDAGLTLSGDAHRSFTGVIDSEDYLVAHNG